MKISSQLKESFPVLDRNLILNEQIIDEPSPLMLKTKLSSFEVLPFYMLWCAENSSSLNTVSDGTLSAIAEYGRCEDKDNKYLNFKFFCNEIQIITVRNFLLWFQNNYEFYDEMQLQRTLARWQ